MEMESIEPFGEDFMLPTDSSVSLKDGIDLRKLLDGEGVSFEVDPSKAPPRAGWENQPYSNEELFEQLNSECALPEDDSDEEKDTSPFERMAKGMKDLTDDGGVLKKVLKAGVGPAVPEGALVRVHYNGYLEYSDEPYDSSRLRNQMQQFRLGQGEVIPGWDVGVATMRKSELARFLIKPEYAFGEMGCPPRIPPSATIMFEVELISFVDHKAADEYEALSREERDDMGITELIDVANSLREAGNDLFGQRMYGPAASKYSKAIRILEPARLKDEQEEERWKEALVKLLLNLGLCSLRQGKPKPAVRHCRRVLELDKKNTKATFRLGQAFMQLGEFVRAREQLLKAARLAPGNEEIRLEMVKLEKKTEQFEALEKAMCSRMMQTSLGSPSAPQALAPSPSQEKTRDLLTEKLLAFRGNPAMEELVLPATISKEEVECVKQLCEEMGLNVELGDKRSGFAVRVSKSPETKSS